MTAALALIALAALARWLWASSPAPGGTWTSSNGRWAGAASARSSSSCCWPARSTPPSPFWARPGFAYGKGAPAYYILAYCPLAYVLVYLLLPPIWRYAREHGLVSQPDFFVRKYDSPALGLLVTLVGLVALVPYLVLQLTGLGIIVSTALRRDLADVRRSGSAPRPSRPTS